MTLILNQFAITPTTQVDTQVLAASGTLPQRVGPLLEKNSFIDCLDAKSAVMHYRFNEGTPQIYDRVNGFQGDAGTTSTYGNTGRVESPKNSSVICGIGTTNDIIIPANGIYNFDFDDDWTIDAWCEPQNGSGTRWMLAKFNGTNGWILQGPSTNANSFAIEFRDGTNTLRVRADIGSPVHGTNGSNIGHFTVVINGNGAGLTASDIELYYDGVLQTNIVDVAGPVNSFAAGGTPIESGRFVAAGGSVTNSERTAMLWDELAIASTAWSAQDVLDVHEAGLEIQDLPTATWQWTAPANVEVKSISIPGGLGNECAEECFPDVKTKCFYSVNSGAQTEFDEHLGNVTIPVSSGSTFEVVVKFPPRGQHLTDIPAWVASQGGGGPLIVYDDLTADAAPTPPPVSSDTENGAGGRLVQVLGGS